MDLSKRYMKSEDIVSRIIGDGTVLMPINRQAINLGNAYALDETAAFIWGHIDGQKSLADICNSIEAVLEVDREQAEQDLLTHIAQFEEMKIIMVVD